MSDPAYTNTNRSPSLSGGHDTGLYDPDRHDNRIVAVYETRERAIAARDELVKVGVASADIEVLDGSQVPETTAVGDSSDHGVWASLKSLFLPEEDAHTYVEGVRRGHSVLSVDPTKSGDRHRLIQALEGTDPVDFDARLEEWRQAGYMNPHSSGIGAAQGMISPAPAPAPDEVSAVDMPVPPTTDAMRAGQREAAPGAVRVRSYVSER